VTRAFIIPSDQPDFGTATKFVNTLVKTGITILRATSSFTVNGKTYPANSFVVKTAQPFRPHVMDMFEPQDHPDDIPYPGGPPTAPYDSTGYTLAFTMGIKFDRILDAFDGPFTKLTDFVSRKWHHSPASGRSGLLLHTRGQQQLRRDQPSSRPTRTCPGCGTDRWVRRSTWRPSHIWPCFKRDDLGLSFQGPRRRHRAVVVSRPRMVWSITTAAGFGWLDAPDLKGLRDAVPEDTRTTCSRRSTRESPPAVRRAHLQR
jgi:hypothetical protein